MKKYLQLALISLFFLAELVEAKETSKQHSVTINHEKSYKKYKGTISNIPIIVDLINNKGKLTGSYYYVKIGIPIQLIGETKENNKFTLTEFDSKGEITGTFDCIFLNNNKIEGNWQNPKTKKVLAVKLEEATQDFPAITLSKNYTEYCDNATKNKLKPANEIEYYDTICSTLSIESAEIKWTNKNVQDKINRKIPEILIGKEYKSFEDFKKSAFNPDAEGGFNQEFICEPSMVDSKILSFSFINYTYYFGAAHPGTFINYENFDLSTGNVITLEDLLIPNYKKELNAIAEQKFVQELGKEGWDFEPGKFTTTENFLITKAGLYFTFNQYEIGPYSAGSPSFLIPYKNIAHLFKENSLLINYFKK
jgi:hypothetical protein